MHHCIVSFPKDAAIRYIGAMVDTDARHGAHGDRGDARAQRERRPAMSAAGIPRSRGDPKSSLQPRPPRITGVPIVSTVAGGSVPNCSRCKRPHLDTLPCWVGNYRKRICEQAYRTHGRHCWQCRREGITTRATQIDHVIPRALGGTDDMRNLQPLCQTHNGIKGAKITSPYGDDATIAGNGRPISPRFR